MRALFVSRKGQSDLGGLARFASELISRSPTSYFLSPDNLTTIFKLPFIEIDLIHLCDATLLPLGILLKLFLRIPLTVTAHGLDLTFSHPMYQLMLKKTLPQVDAVILDSDAARSLLAQFTIAKDKIFVVPPGISIDHFSFVKPMPLLTASLARSHLARLNRVVLLSVGNLVARKGHGWFIEEVFSKLSDDFVYFILGDGPKRDEIENVIAKLKLSKRIFLLGRLSNQELAFVLGESDIYVCPNQHVAGDFEGFGIAVGEAAAMGLPVIASDVDGISEVIKHNKNGLLVAPSAKAFTTAIDLLQEPKTRKAIGQRARHYTKAHFGWQKTVKAYARVFQEVIDKT